MTTIDDAAEGSPEGGRVRPASSDTGSSLGATAPPEIAFYYPGPLWRSGEWVKTLLLFFDGVALLVPE
ncbi:MAG TPA: hypothetical protein VIV12_22100, partial [Streptosporangiaceae bacterium]